MPEGVPAAPRMMGMAAVHDPARSTVRPSRFSIMPAGIRAAKEINSLATPRQPGMDQADGVRSAVSTRAFGRLVMRQEGGAAAGDYCADNR